MKCLRGFRVLLGAALALSLLLGFAYGCIRYRKLR